MTADIHMDSVPALEKTTSQKYHSTPDTIAACQPFSWGHESNFFQNKVRICLKKYLQVTL